MSHLPYNPGRRVFLNTSYHRFRYLSSANMRKIQIFLIDKISMLCYNIDMSTKVAEPYLVRQRIWRLIKDRGTNVHALATASGIPYHSLYVRLNSVRGRKYARFSAEDLAKVAAALEISLDELMSA